MQHKSEKMLTNYIKKYKIFMLISTYSFTRGKKTQQYAVKNLTILFGNERINQVVE